jgi:ParB family chromosome partitioning protein
LKGVSQKLVTPPVIDAVVRKVAERRITNSKDLRKLRAIIPDPIAREHFLSPAGDIDSAMLRLGPAAPKAKIGLVGDLDVAIEAMKSTSWTEVADLKGDLEFLNKLAEAEALLGSLRKTLSDK